MRTLRACRPALQWWAAATGPREVLLATEQAVRTIACEVDLVLVVGFPHPSDSPRPVQAAQREGVPAYLVNDVSEIDLRWLAGVARVGITASAPHLVSVHRTPNPHLAFGHGPRLCVGAPLARVQLKMLFPALLDRFPTLRLAVPVESLRERDEFYTGGLLELPVTW